jgi:hypothetical protein
MDCWDGLGSNKMAWCPVPVRGESLGDIPSIYKFFIMPTQHDLDKDPLLRGRPICLNRVDGHARWVSRRALELMGELPAEVEGGHIVRDTQGNPTGTSNISSPFINVLTDEQRCFCGQRHGSHSYP